MSQKFRKVEPAKIEPADAESVDAELAETLPGAEQVPLELLDDGLDDGLDDDALIQASTFSTSTSSAAPQPTPGRKDLASLGGLRSIVSQGVNMTQAIDEDNAALFDAIVSDPEDLPEDAFTDEDMDAAEQVAAEFASLDWDDFSSESDRVEDAAVLAKPPRQRIAQPSIPAPAPQAAQASQVQKSRVQKTQDKKSQSDIPLFEADSRPSDQVAESEMTDPTRSIAVTSVVVEKPSSQGKPDVVRRPLALTPVQPLSAESEPAQSKTVLANTRVPLPEPPLPGLLPDPLIIEPLISESADDTISTPESSDAGSPTVLKVGDRRELRANAQTAAKEVKESAKSASEYFATGLAYRSRIEAGDRGLSMIDPAIIAYENGLNHLASPHPDRITALNDLGTLYWLKAQQSDQVQAAEYMHQSVRLYQEALVASDRQQANEASQQPSQQHKGIVGQLYSNMGAVYTMLATCEDPLENLTHAAGTYQRALPLISLVSDPEEYATLQNSLGSVFWKLSHYESAENYLHQAISAYNEALLGYKPEQQPLDYAAVQNNLGITYWSLAKHERPEFLLKHAIAAYRDALNYRTSEVDPAACAISYNNLALAYWDLSKHTYTDFAQKSRYQKNAVTAFEAALNISKLSGALSQMDSAAIYHCLGDVHAQMVETAASRNEVADSLQKSLYSYIKATEGLPTDSPAYPGRFGAIVANLRLHYDKLGLEGQQTALNRVPASLLPQVMMTL